MKNFKCVQAFLVVLLLGISFSLSAAQNLSENENIYDGENYYVNPSMIYLAPNGIFLNFEGECIPITTVCSDANGIYVPSYEMNRRLVWCPICQRYRQPNHTCSNYR